MCHENILTLSSNTVASSEIRTLEIFKKKHKTECQTELKKKHETQGTFLTL